MKQLKTLILALFIIASTAITAIAATTYRLTVQASTNSYKPIVLIEETDGNGTLLEQDGKNIIIVGEISVEFKKGPTDPESKIFIRWTDNYFTLTYDMIDGYSIYGTTTGLTDIHEIWDAIASGSQSAL